MGSLHFSSCLRVFVVQKRFLLVDEIRNARRPGGLVSARRIAR